MLINRTTKGGVILETILILAGIAMIVKGLMTGSVTYKFVQVAQHSEGTIVGTSNHGLTHNIQFGGEAGTSGAVFVQDGFMRDLPPGEHVPVLYDPNNPAIAAVDSFAALWFRPIALLVGGMLALIIGFRLRKNRSI